MKKFLILIFVLSINLFAQSPEELMNKANDLYKQQNYQEAISLYQKLIEQGYESAPLYYNLGNAYFREGKIGFAILNYERGLKLDPSDEDLQFNLKLANARTVDKISEVPKLFIILWWESLITFIPSTTQQIIIVFILWILLGSIAIYFFSGKISLQRISFLVGSISLAVLIIFVIIFISRITREKDLNYGVLTEQVYTAKTSPDEKSNDNFVIHEGIKFTIEDEVGNWVKIKLLDGKIGWIEKNSFGRI
ncbi:MAG: tetratricopeptide repeat protein [Melioribacteraceae bacterium]|nr:tetratricopeptide repeat protein [Melioribacteraceae bacterium]